MTEQKLGRVLILDDEVKLANALCSSLTAEGYEAAAFTSGKDALKALETRNFELLLTDLMMPEMDGIEVLHSALEIDQHLACILMTGQGTVQTAVEAMKIGALDYVLKPFKMHMLLPVLARATEVRRLKMENIQLRETLAVFELGQTIAYSLDLGTLVHKAADAALKQLDADEVSVMLPTDEGNELYVAAARGKSRDGLLGKRVPFDKGIAGWVARHHEPVRLDGEVNDPRFTSLFPRSDILSAVSMPMLAGGKLIGVLNVNATKRRPFTMGQVKGLSILVSTAAAALQGAMLYKHLQTAEERYRSIFENAAEGIFQATEDGRFMLANPALARIYGYGSPEELIAEVTDIASQLYIAPEQRDQFKRRLYKQGSVTGFEVQFRRRNGEIVWVSINARKSWNASREEAYYEGTVEHITGRKQAEEALRESEERFRLLVESAPDSIFVQTQGLFTFVNPSALKLFGASSMEQLVGKALFERIHPSSHDQVKERINVINTEKRQVPLSEQKYLRFDGTVVDVETSAVPITYGDHDGALVFVRDITERREAQEALLQKEHYFRSLLVNLHEDILVIDRDRNIIDANKDFLSVTGQRREAIIGSHCFKVLHGFNDACSRWGMECGLEKVFESGKPCGCRHEHITPGGQTVWADMLYSLLRNEEGEAESVILAMRDVTHEVEVEKQFRHAQKMEAIGTLAGGIAHDFNNILGIILGYTEIVLLDCPAEGEIRTGLEQVQKAALRAKDLVQQILAFSRRQEQERAPLQLRVLLQEVLKLLRAAMPSTIEIRQNLDLSSDGADLISADATQIHQVLMNLCTNAGHAMRDKGGVLDVSMSNVHFGPGDPDRPPKLAPGVYVHISVSDTGCGMDDKVIERIFEPYFTTKGVGEGTGLGLSVVHGIVQGHAGAVTVVSQPGVGSTFNVFFPAGASEVELKPEDGLTGIPMGKESLLLVDDEEELARLGKIALERLGYTVLSVSSPRAALEAFRAAPEKFDLVVTDQTMPQMTGMELATEIGRTRSGVPVILCTGFSEFVTEENLRAAGIREVMMKPLIMHALGRAIRRALDRKEAE